MWPGLSLRKSEYKNFLIRAAILALAGSATADLVSSSELDITVSSGDSAIGVGIGSNMWQFGIETGGPLDDSFITALHEGAGLFVPIANETAARHFAAGDNIGTITAVLNMFPLGAGGDYIKLRTHDYENGEGTFDASGTGFISFGFGFGGGVDFSYRWIQFTLDVDVRPDQFLIVPRNMSLPPGTPDGGFFIRKIDSPRGTKANQQERPGDLQDRRALM